MLGRVRAANIIIYAPIPYIKVIEDEDMLTQNIEDCELYGYDIVSKEEFYEIFKDKFES